MHILIPYAVCDDFKIGTARNQFCTISPRYPCGRAHYERILLYPPVGNYHDRSALITGAQFRPS